MEANRKSPDANLPVWFDGKNINEALFCEEFLREHRIIFTNRAFFTPDGRVTDDLSLRGEIYEELKFFTHQRSGYAVGRTDFAIFITIFMEVYHNECTQ